MEADILISGYGQDMCSQILNGNGIS